MIAAIILIAAALTWLGYETRWLTIHLETTEYQRAKLVSVKTETKQVNPIGTPYHWKSPEDKENHINLCINCRLKCPEHKSTRWASWKLPAKTIRAFNSTLNLNEGCNIWRASFLKQVAREYKRKPVVSQPPLFKTEYIYQVRIGSHHEYVRWNHETQEYDYARKPKTGYSHRVVEDYNTNYRDCLPSKKWLKAHEHDVYPEPTIELRVSDKTLSVNGNYRKGIIREFVKANKI